MNESEFVAVAERTLALIGEALDAALDASALDLDWRVIDGILEIEAEDGSRIIVNRHVPNREMWLASKSGGYHFAARDGRWRDTRSGATLEAALARELHAQAGLAVEFPALEAP